MNRKWFTIIVIALLALVLSSSGVVGQQSSPAQPSEPEITVTVTDVVNSRISYQGVLKENDDPVSGNRDMVFNLYSNNSCTALLDSIVKNDVPVTNGLFSIELDVSYWFFDGQGVWLKTEVAGVGFSCQEILPVPYALSLRPGAEIKGEYGIARIASHYSVFGEEYDSGLYGYSDGIFAAGVRGESDTFGVYGKSRSGYGVYGRSDSTTGARGVYGYASATEGDDAFGVYGESNSPGGAGVYGVANNGGWSAGVRGVLEEGPGAGVEVMSADYGVFIQSSGTGVFSLSADGTGVDGRSTSSTGTAVYGRALATSGVVNGVKGVSESTNGGAAVAGISHGNRHAGWFKTGDFASVGVFNESNDHATLQAENLGVGVAALFVNESDDHATLQASNEGTGMAAQFWGDVAVYGNISKSGGGFKIDHPLDPEDQYLNHSFVESPDMMNMYNGNVRLDNNGNVWVELPDYFEALNRDFRYQLTPIGASAPNLYIAEEIHGNRFKIAGGPAAITVSWQVTGIRQDPWANAHRIPVEEAKLQAEQGFYRHPTLYGQPESVAERTPATLGD